MRTMLQRRHSHSPRFARARAAALAKLAADLRTRGIRRPGEEYVLRVTV